MAKCTSGCVAICTFLLWKYWIDYNYIWYASSTTQVVGQI